MKKITKKLMITLVNLLIITSANLLISSSVYAQSPQSFKYQAIVRDANGDVLDEQNVSLRISILKTSATGTVIYSETHSEATNNFGLINLNIGTGTPVTGDFSTIDWASDSYFIKVEMDPTGGTSYQAMGTSQLLSVPYALHANTAETATETDPVFGSSVASGITGTDTANWNTAYNWGDHSLAGYLTSESSDWKLSGNTGTISGTDFIGTTDNQDFDIRTNNAIKWRFKTNGTLEFLNTGNSVFIGEGAGANDDLSNNENVFVGYQSGNSNTTGYYNTANGTKALYSNTTGYKNTANGSKALYSNTTGSYNTANGYYALYSNTTGNNNTANGYYALRLNTTGNFNTANGYYALYSNTTGTGNTTNGYFALTFNTTGNYNTANGYWTLYSNTTGSSNVAIGTRSLYKNTDRSNLVAIGDSALFNNGTGATTSYEATENTAIGHKALYFNTTGYSNTANGSDALFSNTTGYKNTANGYYALYSNTTGYNNTANGYYALYSNTTGYKNTANGYYALVLNTTGNFNTANGYYALYSNTTGSNNTANGNNALHSNTTGNDNTALGYYAFFSGGAYENSTALGYNAAITASNQIRLGNNSVTSIGGYPAWTSLSDKRFKKDVRENVPGLNFIMKLKPVTYHLDMNAIARFLNTPDSLRLKDAEAIKANMLQTGFLAQDVEKSAQEIGFDFSGVDAPKNENDHYGLRYAEFVVPLVKAVQEQQKEIELLKKEIELLKKNK